MAVTFGWKGAVDTDLQFSEFYGNNHSVVIWFLLQYPLGYAGPILSVNGTGNYLIGQGDRNSQNHSHLISRIEDASGIHIPKILAADQWHHLAVVRENITMSIFLDGSRIGSQPILTGNNSPVGTLRLGRPSPGAGVDNQEAQFFGMMDDLAVYNRALTSAEISSQFLNRDHLSGNEPGLLDGWKFWPSPSTRPHPRMLRDVAYSGHTSLVLSSVNWSGLDSHLMPFPNHDLMELPFLSGEAWSIGQGFAAEYSHRGYAAFCWDFLKAGAGNGWGDLYPNGSFRAPVYSTGTGEVIFASDQSPPVDPANRETENMFEIQGADGFIRAHLHLLKDTIRVGVGHQVKNGQPMAQISTEWRDPHRPAPHLHFAINPSPNDMIGRVTIPSAFSNYEVQRPNGTWAFVSIGIPKIGEIVRRTGPMSKWDEIGHANRVVAMATASGKLFAATSDNKLWWRDPVGTNVNWTHIGHANKVVGMAACSGKLFAATSDNKLWWRNPVGTDIKWIQIGHANNVVAMAASNIKLYAVTSDSRLWQRDPVGTNVNWTHIGHANNVTAMAADRGKLFVATSENKLWWRDFVETNVNWDHIGHANNVVAMTATTGKLFAATKDNKFWWRDS